MIKKDLINWLYEYTDNTKIIRPIVDVADVYEILSMIPAYRERLQDKNEEKKIVDELNRLNIVEIN